MSTPDRPRFVLGSVGPGTKLPTLGHETFARLRDAYAECGRGLLAGGADALVVETCQDLLQAKAAVLGMQQAMTAEGRRVPIDRAGDRRDHRHDAAGQRDRRRAHRAGAARHRPHRAQLRHGPRRDERAPAHAVQARAHPAVGDAQRRAARARPERRRVPAHRRRAGRGAVRVRPRLRPAAGRRLLRHHARRTSAPWPRRSATLVPADAPPPPRARARARSTPPCRSGRTPRCS